MTKDLSVCFHIMQSVGVTIQKSQRGVRQGNLPPTLLLLDKWLSGVGGGLYINVEKQDTWSSITSPLGDGFVFFDVQGNNGFYIGMPWGRA